MVSVVDQINPWIHILVADPAIGRHVPMPFRRIVPNEVVHATELWIFSDDSRILRCSSSLNCSVVFTGSWDLFGVATLLDCWTGTSWFGRKESTIPPAVRKAVYPLPRER